MLLNQTRCDCVVGWGWAGDDCSVCTRNSSNTVRDRAFRVRWGEARRGGGGELSLNAPLCRGKLARRRAHMMKMRSRCVDLGRGRPQVCHWVLYRGSTAYLSSPGGFVRGHLWFGLPVHIYDTRVCNFRGRGRHIQSAHVHGAVRCSYTIGQGRIACAPHQNICVWCHDRAIRATELSRLSYQRYQLVHTYMVAWTCTWCA